MKRMAYLRKNIFLITSFLITIIIIIIIFIKRELYNNRQDVINEELVLEKESIPEKKEDDIEILCTVDIKGEINLPGIYTTECTKKVQDIIDLANGLTANADTSNLNLAKKITDEMVIIVYSQEEVINNECTCDNSVVNEASINNTGETVTNSNLININTATIAILKSIPGIGDTKAKAIIDYRNTYGAFKSVEELKNVKGIGDKLYEQIKIYFTT